MEDILSSLAKLRDLTTVTTICMHGNPLSRINNLDLLQTRHYKALDIVDEPWLDVDYSRVFYMTDTERK
ncbi:MAG TPA: hypothetical protein VKN82_00170 [Desulfohalobiaceae bacterium]|nr:hypothetical protein [Desulfohalobiaceae bacterium]